MWKSNYIQSCILKVGSILSWLLFILIWYLACKTQLDVGFQTQWPDLLTPLSPHHVVMAFGISLAYIRTNSEWCSFLVQINVDSVMLTVAKIACDCKSEWLPLAIGSRPAHSCQLTWCSAVPIVAVFLRLPNVFRPDVKEYRAWINLELHESQSNF